jgi:tRNA(Ile)-lysidine synthase
MSDKSTHLPLSAAEFDRCMAACGPFEPECALAVAVSGGADSLALCLLADRWARGRGGKVIGLTVDHGLRPESGSEAAKVGVWLKKYGIEHYILSWTGVKPDHGIQQAARAARYRLLGGWCAVRGLLHLLVAHHREDQAETYALRLARGSGVEGLAAMAPVGRLPEQMADAPLLKRPLLAVAKARLVSGLEALGQPWVDDPSNDLGKYQRVRIRRLFAAGAAGGLTIDGAALAVGTMQQQKAAEEALVVRFLSRHAFIDPAGFGSFDRRAFCRLGEDIAWRSLARMVMVLGGRVYPPRSKRLAKVVAAIRSQTLGGWTLSGCLFEAAAQEISVFREAATCVDEVILDPSAGEVFWDRRFRVASPPGDHSFSGQFMIKKLGYAGWCAAVAQDSSLRENKIPFRAKLSLPAVFQGDRLLAVPHLGFTACGSPGRVNFISQFDPARSLSA